MARNTTPPAGVFARARDGRARDAPTRQYSGATSNDATGRDRARRDDRRARKSARDRRRVERGRRRRRRDGDARSGKHVDSRSNFRQNFLEAYFNTFYACTPTFTRKRQRVARRTPQKVSTQKHCTPGATFFTFRVPHPESRLAVWRKKRVPRELVYRDSTASDAATANAHTSRNVRCVVRRCVS